MSASPARAAVMRSKGESNWYFAPRVFFPKMSPSVSDQQWIASRDVRKYLSEWAKTKKKPVPGPVAGEKWIDTIKKALNLGTEIQGAMLLNRKKEQWVCATAQSIHLGLNLIANWGESKTNFFGLVMRGGDFVVLTVQAGTVWMSGTEQRRIAEPLNRAVLSQSNPAN